MYTAITMKFSALVTALIALVAPAAAFAPIGARTRGLTTISMAGYVPDGLSPAQYKALKAKEAAAAKANKKKMVRCRRQRSAQRGKGRLVSCERTCCRCVAARRNVVSCLLVKTFLGDPPRSSRWHRICAYQTMPAFALFDFLLTQCTI